jgi:hypothetical protein
MLMAVKCVTYPWKKHGKLVLSAIHAGLDSPMSCLAVASGQTVRSGMQALGDL